MSIRTATRLDQTQLGALMRQYLVDFFGHTDPGMSAIEAYIGHLLDNPGQGVLWVFEEQHRLEGFATLFYSFSTLRLKPIGILNDLFVRPESRGKGIGEKLFDHCREDIRARGGAFLQWETARDNRVAQGLYRKMGGQISDLLVYTVEV